MRSAAFRQVGQEQAELVDAECPGHVQRRLNLLRFIVPVEEEISPRDLREGFASARRQDIAHPVHSMREAAADMVASVGFLRCAADGEDDIVRPRGDNALCPSHAFQRDTVRARHDLGTRRVASQYREHCLGIAVHERIAVVQEVDLGERISDLSAERLYSVQPDIIAVPRGDGAIVVRLTRRGRASQIATNGGFQNKNAGAIRPRTWRLARRLVEGAGGAPLPAPERFLHPMILIVPQNITDGRLMNVAETAGCVRVIEPAAHIPIGVNSNTVLQPFASVAIAIGREHQIAGSTRFGFQSCRRSVD